MKLIFIVISFISNLHFLLFYHLYRLSFFYCINHVTNVSQRTVEKKLILHFQFLSAFDGQIKAKMIIKTLLIYFLLNSTVIINSLCHVVPKKENSTYSDGIIE